MNIKELNYRSLTFIIGLISGYGTVDDVTDNLVVIDILFTSTQETEITELVSYGWGNFLGEFFRFLMGTIS